MYPLKTGDVILRPRYEWFMTKQWCYPRRKLVGFQAAIVVGLDGERVKWRNGMPGLDGRECVGTSDRRECIAITALENLGTDEISASKNKAGAAA